MDRAPQIYLLSTNLARLGLTDETGRRASGPVPLGRALASSPVWDEVDNAILVVRPSPTPLVAILGYFDTAQHAKLAALQWQLEHILPRLRYVNYRQAERACARVASRLIARFGREEMAHFRYMAMPRGGLFVLGMLGYVLDVPREQLEFPHPVHEPLVVVDDCALTGLRFRQFLKNCPSKHIVFAHLCSHPALREAIETREPQVNACVSAQDLHDYAPEQLGEDYDAWRDRWLARSPEAYWVGLTDHVCFPWTEPDVAIWNPETGQEQAGWRLVPPELCLKNRPTPEAQPNRLQIQPLGPGPLRAAPHVIYGELGNEIIVANVETSETFALTGVAAGMWKAITTLGRLSDIAATIVEQYDVDASRVNEDLCAFVKELMRMGLVEAMAETP